ncbi:MAG: helix-turn-helix transcriptional regulator [Myxococcales bacterium]|nr:helix-turn-helix transcriptional regulator [Myxococcales bacterium]
MWVSENSDVFRALADPTRRAILEQLALGETTVKDLTARFSVSQPAVSQHLAALRRAGLVSERRAGRFAHYRANPEGLRPLVEWIDHFRSFWPERIRRLEGLLQEMDE